MKFLAATLAVLSSMFAVIGSEPLSSWGEYSRPAGASAPVAITFGGGVFVAVGGAGTIISSTDGITWTKQTSGTSQNFQTAKFVNGRFFAFGATSAVTSADGTNWTAVASSDGQRDITFDGSRYLATVWPPGVPSKYLMISTNLTNWAQASLTLPSNFLKDPEFIGYADGKYLLNVGSSAGAAGSLETFYSGDAIVWTKGSGISATGAGSQGQVTFQNGLFIQTTRNFYALGGSILTLNIVAYSSDGINWNRALTVPTSTSAILPAKIATGGGYFVFPTGGAIYYTNSLPSIFGYTAPDWPRVDLSPSSAAETSSSDVAFGNDVFVAVTLGKIFKSNPVVGSASVQITRQPASLAVIAGASAKLTVLAQGSDPITYQWRHAGTNLVGETSNTLSLTNITVAMAGSYDVVITNPAGPVTSNPATLSVSFAEAHMYAGVTLHGSIGDRFLLEYQDALDTTGTWHGLGNVTLPTASFIYIDYGSSEQTNRFYRATFLAP
jgi:hypothetical protein